MAVVRRHDPLYEHVVHDVLADLPTPACRQTNASSHTAPGACRSALSLSRDSEHLAEPAPRVRSGRTAVALGQKPAVTAFGAPQ